MQAGAAEKDVPLYKHLADLAGNSKLVSPAASSGQRLHGLAVLIIIEIIPEAPSNAR